MSDSNQSLRLLAILAEADHEAFLASATAARCAADGVEITLIGTKPELDDSDEAVCELVAHIRRLRPNVVITSGPWDDRIAVSQLATAAVMRAPDPRYGHRCCSRGAHAVGKLYYTAAHGPVSTRIQVPGEQPADTYYRAFSTVNCEGSLETDLFDGLRPNSSLVALAA